MSLAYFSPKTDRPNGESYEMPVTAFRILAKSIATEQTVGHTNHLTTITDLQFIYERNISRLLRWYERNDRLI